jgi:hypothetical protein
MGDPLYRVTFERVGRNHYVPPLEVVATDGDMLAHHIHAYAGRFLGSKDYMVAVAGDHGSIEGGRFGRFTIETL